jgi:hypothetical protein
MPAAGYPARSLIAKSPPARTSAHRPSARVTVLGCDPLHVKVAAAVDPGGAEEPRGRLLLMNLGSAGSRWLWFCAWALPGACFALSISVLAIFALPLGILGVFALRRRTCGGEALGLLAGAGVAVAAIGSIHLRYQSCSASRGSLLLRVGQTSVGSSCGGVDGIQWLIAGLALTAVAVILCLRASRRSSSNGRAITPMVG